MGQTIPHSLSDIALVLQHGGVIAYPTEAVFGLGCDPYNRKAVQKLLEIKQRDPTKGLIVIGASWQQLEPLIAPVPTPTLARVFATWPGAITWVFPASANAPKWIQGENHSVALRIPAHALARQICMSFKGPIISTSANLEGSPSIRDLTTVKMLFGKQVDMVVPGKVGDRIRPSEIRDAISGDVLREG